MCLLWARLDLLKVASLVVQTVKCLPAMWETQVRSLGWGDPLEKEMAIHTSILVCKIPWTEEPGRLQSMGLQKSEHDLATTDQTRQKKVGGKKRCVEAV